MSTIFTFLFSVEMNFYLNSHCDPNYSSSGNRELGLKTTLRWKGEVKLQCHFTEMLSSLPVFLHDPEIIPLSHSIYSWGTTWTQPEHLQEPPWAISEGGVTKNLHNKAFIVSVHPCSQSCVALIEMCRWLLPPLIIIHTHTHMHTELRLGWKRELRLWFERGV